MVPGSATMRGKMWHQHGVRRPESSLSPTCYVMAAGSAPLRLEESPVRRQLCNGSTGGRLIRTPACLTFQAVKFDPVLTG